MINTIATSRLFSVNTLGAMGAFGAVNTGPKFSAFPVQTFAPVIGAGLALKTQRPAIDTAPASSGILPPVLTDIQGLTGAVTPNSLVQLLQDAQTSIAGDQATLDALALIARMMGIRAEPRIGIGLLIHDTAPTWALMETAKHEAAVTPRQTQPINRIAVEVEPIADVDLRPPQLASSGASASFEIENAPPTPAMADVPQPARRISGSVVEPVVPSSFPAGVFRYGIVTTPAVGNGYAADAERNTRTKDKVTEARILPFRLSTKLPAPKLRVTVKTPSPFAGERRERGASASLSLSPSPSRGCSLSRFLSFPRDVIGNPVFIKTSWIPTPPSNRSGTSVVGMTTNNSHIRFVKALAKSRGINLHRPRGAEKTPRDVFAATTRNRPEKNRPIVIERKIGVKAVERIYYLHQSNAEPIFAGRETVPVSVARTPELDTGLQATIRPSNQNDIGPVAFPLGNPGGETAPSQYTANERKSIGEYLADLVIQQLSLGPDSLSDLALWESFNDVLAIGSRADGYEHISDADWNVFLRESLIAAVHSTPVIFDRGMLSFDATLNAAADVLRISRSMLDNWEAHFRIEDENFDLVAAQAAEEEIAEAAGKSPMLGKLVGELHEQIAVRANIILGGRNTGHAITSAQDANLQWLAVSVSSLSSDERVGVAEEYVRAMEKVNVHAAGRFLALLVKHSDLGLMDLKPGVPVMLERNPIAPRWTKDEITDLLRRLMSGSDIVGHRSFRQNFLARLNDVLNKIAIEDHRERTVERLRRIDPIKASDDEFFAEVDPEMEQAAFDEMVKNINALSN